MKLPHVDRRKILLPLAVLAISVVGAAALVHSAPELESVTPEKVLTTVRVMEAHAETVQLWVRSQGTVVPRTESDLVPEVSGPVVWISPALVSGGYFEQGDPLLRIDPRDYEAAVAKARANIARAEGEREHADSELARLDGLSKRDVASVSQLDGARRASRVAKATLDEARVGLDQAERDLARSELLAPFSGRVRDARVDVGQFVSRGTAIATLYATDYVEIRLPIADHQLAYLDLPVWRAGQPPGPGPDVVIHARFAGAEHEWQGAVVRTEGEIDTQSRMVHVVARVADPYGAQEASESRASRPPLAVGLFVRAEIAGQQIKDVIVVPRSAMRNDNQILVVDAEDRLALRDMNVLRIDRDQVLIQGELGKGERICVTPLQVVVEGMRVIPMPVHPVPGPLGTRS